MILYDYDEQKQLEIERVEWKAEGKAEAVIELLKDLGNIPKDLYDRITRKTNLSVLTRWLKTAARAESVEEFTEKMERRASIPSLQIPIFMVN